MEELTNAQAWEAWFQGFSWAMGFISTKILIWVVARLRRPTAPEL